MSKKHLSPAASAGVYFAVAFLICIGVLVAIAVIKIDRERSSFFAPPPDTSSKKTEKTDDASSCEEAIQEKQKAVAESPKAEASDEVESATRTLSVQEIVSSYRHPMVPATPSVPFPKDDAEDDLDMVGRASTLTIENLNEELAPRHSSFAEVQQRLTMEGHMVFVPQKEYLSGLLPCNPGRRLDRMIRHAVRVHDVETFELALSSGADLSVRTTMAYTLLHESIVVDTYMDFMTKLLSYNADGVAMLNSQTSHGSTLLMKAVECKQAATAQMLLERGADINAQDASGRTALMVGAMSNTSWAAKVLIPWGADPDLVDVDGRRAVDLALLYGNARVASDLNGSALAVVPGYIAPSVQTNIDGLNLIYIITWHGFDVATDVVLAISLAQSGHPVLCFFTAFFLFLPSVFIFCIPYQSIVERVLTLFQMRIIYEGLISMGQERLTVRFGATQMYHTVLQNVPQSVMQTYMLALLYQGDHSMHSNKTTLILAILSTVYQSTTTFHNMYLMRFFVKDNKPSSEKFYIKIALTLGIMMGVIVRVTMWGSTLIVYPEACVLLFLWVFLTRFRLIGVGMERGSKDDRSQLEATVVDLFATFLSDVPFITNSQCFLTSLLLSSAENMLFLGPCLPYWNNYPAINAMISLSWLWFVFSVGLVAYVHGDYLRFPDKPFLLDFCLLNKFHAQLMTLYLDSKVATVVAFTVLAKEFERYLDVRRQRRTEKEKEKEKETCSASTSEAQLEEGNSSSNGSTVLADTMSPLSTHLEPAEVSVTPLAAGVSTSDKDGAAARTTSDASTVVTTQSPMGSARSETASEKKRKVGPVAPPLLKEKILTFQLPSLKYATLETREKFSIFLVFCIVLFGFLALVGAMAGCKKGTELKNSVYDYDDYYDDTMTDDHKYACAGKVTSSYGYFSIGVAPWLMFAFGVYYILEAATCQVAQQLRNVWPEERGYDAYLQARGKKPSFFWFSESYHMETRTETITVSDGRGGTRTETRSQQVKVVTHTASMYYSFDYWLDVSDEFPTNIHLARIDTGNYPEFDAYTENDYNTRYEKFKRDNDKDVYQNCSKTFMVGGSPVNALPIMLIYSSKAPYFLRYTYYLCAVLLLMAPWYRWYVTNMSASCTVNIRKQVRKYAPEADTTLLLRWGLADA